MSGHKRNQAKKTAKLGRILGFIAVGLGIIGLIWILNSVGCI